MSGLEDNSMMSATPAIVCWMLLPVVGAWLGLSISWDWSNHPSFQIASWAFVGFWTVFGWTTGWAVGTKVYHWLRHLEYFG